MARILHTASRAPANLAIVRACAAAGHTVFAADTFAWTPAACSRSVTHHFVLPPPRQQPRRFGAMLADIVTTHQIDLLIPGNEEVFTVAQHYGRLAPLTRVLCEPRTLLAGWHHKGHFTQRAAARGIAVPTTHLLTARMLPPFAAPAVLKPAYSRFGQQVYHLRPGDPLPATCHPTPRQPWLLQAAITGEQVCSYTIVQQGHVAAHVAYRTPYRARIGAGIAFVSDDGTATLAIVRRLLAGTRYTGQLGLDFIRTSTGQLVLLECNPRATSGVHLVAPPALAHALTAPPPDTPHIAPAGVTAQVSLALLAYHPAAALRGHLRPSNDVLYQRDDPLPALAQVATLLHFGRVARRHGTSLLAATTADIEWNGDDDHAL